MTKVIITLLPFLLVLIHLADSLLRCAAFQKQIKTGETKRLVWLFGGFALLNLFFYDWLFSTYKVEAYTYKTALMLGWIPYLFIFIFSVKRSFVKHIFVHGMVSVWSLMLHSIGAIIVVAFWGNFPPEALLSFHGAIYLLLFFLFGPVEYRIFGDLLSRFPNVLPYGYYIAAAPYIIILSHLMLWADGELIHSPQERISRLALPVCFFFMYRYALASGFDFYARQNAERDNEIVRNQIDFLRNMCALTIEKQKAISDLRDDLRRTFLDVRLLLVEGNTKKATELVEQQIAILSKDNGKF